MDNSEIQRCSWCSSCHQIPIKLCWITEKQTNCVSC